MKKITLRVFAAALAALTLTACGGEPEVTTADKVNTTAPAVTTKESPAEQTTAPETTQAPETTVAPETTDAPETTQAPATTEGSSTPEPSEPAGGEIENLYYAIDVDLTIVDGNAGIVFSGADSNNFVMWQLAIGEYSDGNLWLRPHTWVNGGGACVDQVVLNDVEGLENVSAEYGDQHHMTIRVFNDGVIETLIDSVSVGTTDVVANVVLTDTLGMIGFRCDAYNNGTIPEVGLFDNLKITDASGAVLYEDDFSDADSTLCGALVDENQVVLEDGALKVTGRYLNMTEVVA